LHPFIKDDRHNNIKRNKVNLGRVQNYKAQDEQLKAEGAFNLAATTIIPQTAYFIRPWQPYKKPAATLILFYREIISYQKRRKGNTSCNSNTTTEV